MSLSIGIVGLPNVGKSTLFNALTKKGVPAENYPFCTIDPSVGIVPVPDERLDRLAELSNSAKKIPAIVEFVDIAGLVRGASEGEGLGNQFLSHIREVDAIAQVVRVFEDSNITHVSGKVDPLDDIQVINLELSLADLQTVTKRLSNLQKDVKKGDKNAKAEEIVLQKIEQGLKEGKRASDIELKKDEVEILKSLHLLSAKPILYVLNVSEVSSSTSFDATNVPGTAIQIDPVFGKGLDELIKKSYELLGLITFFTTGEDETRGWTIKKDSTAPEAGAAIHSDFQDKFIRAEVVAYDDLVSCGSYSKARDKGLLRTEGKAYIVKDGDVIEFKI